MSRRKLLASASLVASLSIMVTLGSALAQDATPTVDRSPNPDECVVAGTRTVVELQAIYGTPAAEGAGEATSLAEQATPETMTLPTGEPADAATVDAITARVRLGFACYNAGDNLAGFSLVTDEFLVTQVGTALFDEDFVASLEASPVPLTEEQQTEMIGVRDVTVYADGRVGALVDYIGHYPSEAEGINGLETDLWIFKNVDGVWKLDEVYQNLEALYGPEATPGAAPAT